MKTIAIVIGFGILLALLWIGWSLRTIARHAGYPIDANCDLPSKIDVRIVE
jgi:hypothetical protein